MKPKTLLPVKPNAECAQSLHADGTSAARIAYTFGNRLRERQIFSPGLSKTPGAERHYCDGVEKEARS